MSRSVLIDSFDEQIELVSGKPRPLYEEVPSVRFRKESTGLFSVEIQDWVSHAGVTLVVGQEGIELPKENSLLQAKTPSVISYSELDPAVYPTKLEQLVIGFAEWAGWLTDVDHNLVEAFLSASPKRSSSQGMRHRTR